MLTTSRPSRTLLALFQSRSVAGPAPIQKFASTGWSATSVNEKFVVPPGASGTLAPDCGFIGDTLPMLTERTPGTPRTRSISSVYVRWRPKPSRLGVTPSAPPIRKK